MKKIAKRIFFSVFIITLFIDIVDAQIGRMFEDKIESILSKKYHVYKLDFLANERVFSTIDKFFKEKIEKSHKVWYERTPLEISFTKDFRKPTQKLLTDNEVSKIARDFITLNKFILSSSKDKIAGLQVYARKLNRYNEKAELEEEYLILQRAIFNRIFNDLNVINSKQIVDVHPETKEILAYKSIYWTPIAEDSGRDHTYQTKEEIIKHIDDVLKISQDMNTIQNIEAAYLQTEKLLVPVLVVKSETSRSASRGRPSEKRSLLIMLAKDLPKPDEVTKMRPPKKH